MLQSKDINKILELKNDFTHRWFEPEFIFRSLKCFSFLALCKSLNPVKVRGYSFEVIFSILISLPFVGIKAVNAVTSSVMARHIEAREGKRAVIHVTGQRKLIIQKLIVH